ncbi:TPA_asm: hypothetical protein GJG82_08830 [Salmonella enterica subsp. enterica serovar Enteritidis]|uniref:Uncharacterized protein n=1 Tax=Salmonella enteritidis TaxID=149539 RepID=A0A6Y0HFW9_SALEN|nr:hypothetical protein [Salmonella enterica]EBG2439014.1 hypothetical protein [Salmonella enterica subsp. enterica serovar Enteritidis]EBA9549227.1 hypothetical protein [Salmonella enterica]EBE4746504.1 hypothetical protein [Salmonella enterica]EDE5859652.1 hypothetical protein [Salmonella enterica subsp. enterica serovar Enteritidis]
MCSLEYADSRHRVTVVPTAKIRPPFFSVSIYLPFEKPLIRRLLYSRILQYTLAFQRVKINSINVVVIFTLLAI